jgi:hypothetical protein
MPWSDDARVMARPFRAYAALAVIEDHRPARTAALRALLILLVIGAFVSLTTAGRLVAFHVVSTMVFWSFVPLVQAAAFAAALSLAAPRSPRPKIAPALALYFTGHGPWMVLFWIVAGVCLLAPHVYETMMWLIRSGVLPVMLLGTIAWSGVITFACFRSGVGLSRGRAAAATALFYAGFTTVIVGYYLSMNEIQPQLPPQLPWGP